MVLKSFLDALPSSPVAPLFLGLADAKVESAPRKDGSAYDVVKLRLRSPLGSDEDSAGVLLIVEDEKEIQLRIPNLTTSKDPVCLARCGDLNHTIKVGRLYWDPEDGEIGVDWTILKDPGSEPSLVVLEWTVACLLHVHIGETLFFFARQLDAPQWKGVAKPLLEAAHQRALAEMLPLVAAVLKG